MFSNHSDSRRKIYFFWIAKRKTRRSPTLQKLFIEAPKSSQKAPDNDKATNIWKFQKWSRRLVSFKKFD